LDLHAVADNPADGVHWRDGSKTISSWTVKDVATGTRLAQVTRLPDGLYRLVPRLGSISMHPSLMASLNAASAEFVPTSASH
jgi:hypothetical protein